MPFEEPHSNTRATRTFVPFEPHSRDATTRALVPSSRTRAPPANGDTRARALRGVALQHAGDTRAIVPLQGLHSRARRHKRSYLPENPRSTC
nr:MAG: hypothetical protein DIU78_08325 [Pseudomonadota bacterium]